MAGKLGILAGGGVLPRLLVNACRNNDRDVFILAFEGHTPPETPDGVEHAWVRLGAVGTALATLKNAGVQEIVLAGPIRRPSIVELRPDGVGLKLLAKAGARAFGDDGLLRAIIGQLEDEGFTIVGIDDVLEGIKASTAPLGKYEPDTIALEDVARGVEVLRHLGAADVGQAVVVQQGIVLGVEAAEGTDGLIARCGALAREGPGGVLIKLRKPGQEDRADLPTIGTETVRQAHHAGIRGIAVEAGATLVISAEAAIREADEAGMFIIGISVV